MTQRLLFEMAVSAGQDVKEGPDTDPAAQDCKDVPRSPVNRAVSPLADLALRETCAFCGCEVDASGCVIPDFEELGAFCKQACADRRFRIYLEREA